MYCIQTFFHGSVGSGARGLGCPLQGSIFYPGRERGPYHGGRFSWSDFLFILK